MTTIKVSVQTRDRLKRLADEEHLTMDAALSRALDQVEDARFWQGVRADYARLQADPSEWADYVGELAEWDAATSDGLPALCDHYEVVSLTSDHSTIKARFGGP